MEVNANSCQIAEINDLGIFRHAIVLLIVLTIWKKRTFQPSYFKVLWSLPQSSSLRACCRNQVGLLSVSLLFQGLHCKYPTSTATSPQRSDHSRHLKGRNAHEHNMQSVCLFFLISVTFSETYPASVVCVHLSSHLFYYCQLDLEALSKCSTNIFMKNVSALPGYCIYRLIPLSLPFTKLSHSRNHCMLMHRITVGASSAWNSLFSYRRDSRLMPLSFNTEH